MFRKEVAALFESVIAAHVASRLAPVEAVSYTKGYNKAVFDESARREVMESELSALRATVAKMREHLQDINEY